MNCVNSFRLVDVSNKMDSAVPVNQGTEWTDWSVETVTSYSEWGAINKKSIKL